MDLESSCRVDPCELAADDDQTRQGENTRKQEKGPALEIRQKLQSGEEMDVMLICCICLLATGSV